MKLHVFGDSFATYGDSGTWPHSLGTLLNANSVECHGVPGSSLFYTYTKILEADIQPTDFVVVVVTYYSRLYYSKPPHYPNFGTARKHFTEYNDPVANASMLYYVHLQDNQFDEYVYQHLLTDIELTLSQRTINYVLVPGFKPLNSNKCLASKPLLDIVLYQNNRRSMDDCDAVYNLKNHLTTYNQTILANGLYNHLTGATYKLPMNYFKTLE